MAVDMEKVKEVADSVRDYYQEHQIFLNKVGFGKKPALVIIDMAYAWTDPAYASGSDRLDEAVEGIQRILPLFREKELPVVYTTSPVRGARTDDPFFTQEQTGYRPIDERAWEIDERLPMAPTDHLLYKEHISSFFGTYLASYLIHRNVDTLVVTGCSTSACVRATATDAHGYGFKPIIPRQCVQDRVAAAHEYNLVDIDAKFGDVVDVQEVVDYLKRL